MAARRRSSAGTSSATRRSQSATPLATLLASAGSSARRPPLPCARSALICASFSAICACAALSHRFSRLSVLQARLVRSQKVIEHAMAAFFTYCQGLTIKAWQPWCWWAQEGCKRLQPWALPTDALASAMHQCCTAECLLMLW